MTYHINTAETGLSDETVATTTNTDDGTAGPALTVTTSASGTVRYDTAIPHRGALAYRCDAPASGDVARLDMPMAATTAATLEPYIRLTAYPAAEQALVQFRSASGIVAYVAITAAGNARLFDAGGTALWLSTTAIPLNQYVRYSLIPTVGTNATSPYNGTLTFAYYSGANLETSTATETASSFFGGSSPTAANTGTASITVFRVGKMGSGGIWSGIQIDDIQWNDTTAAAIGAPVAALPVNSWTQTNIVRVNATATSGSPSSQTLTYVSGPSVTITQPTTGTFDVALPGSMTAATVLSLASTNAGGTDTDTITINPPGEAAVTTDALIFNGTSFVAAP